MKAYFHANGTLVIESDTPIETFALKQWAKTRETDVPAPGLPLLLKFDAAPASAQP